MGEAYTIISDRGSIDEKAWSLFACSHPQGNIFHSSWMVNLHLSATGSSPVTLFCLDALNNIRGLLVAYIMKEGTGVVSLLTSRAVIWGGPLVLKDDITVCELLINELKTKLRGKTVYIQIRNMSDTGNLRSVFEKEGFVFEDHLDILFDIHQPVKSRWEGMHPTRRKQINRATRRGVSTYVTLEPTARETELCYHLLREVYRKTKLPLPGLSFFLKAGELNKTEQRMGMIAALYEGQIIGFRFFLVYNSLIYDWYAASNEEHYDKYPNDILPWALMEWGNNNGYLTFDFGGAGDPHKKYGVRDYKLKFGGETVNYGRYLFIARPLIYYFGKTFINLRKKITG